MPIGFSEATEELRIFVALEEVLAFKIFVVLDTAHLLEALGALRLRTLPRGRPTQA
ncbi:MAG TPA: hypothetical protein VEY30_11355 [Myxococcaceae bacterium]|nr:hypothetical protein [Myxococcaceae bacterium]